MPIEVKGLGLAKLSPRRAPDVNQDVTEMGLLRRTPSLDSDDSFVQELGGRPNQTEARCSTGLRKLWDKGVATAAWHAQMALQRIEPNYDVTATRQQLHRLPPQEWFVAFLSKDKKERMEAYKVCEENDRTANSPWNLPMDFYWRDLKATIFEHPTRPAELILMRALIYRVCGEMAAEATLFAAREALGKLAESSVQRKYGAHLLRSNFITSVSGNAHQSDLEIVHGRVDDVRSVFEAIATCLSDDELSKRLFDVPDRYFKPEFRQYAELAEKKPVVGNQTLARANLIASRLGSFSMPSYMALICTKGLGVMAVACDVIVLALASVYLGIAYGFEAAARFIADTSIWSSGSSRSG